MPYKDKDQEREYQREYQREYKRMKRAGEHKTPGKELNPEDIITAKGLLKLLTDVIAEVRGTEADPFTRARCIGYLCSIALKTVETADLEERITQLENSYKANVNH